MRPMLDPERDLAGATPETLARALLRPLRGRRGEDKDDVGVAVDDSTGVTLADSSVVGNDGGEQTKDGMRFAVR